jgi:hypothetical protein
MLREISEERFRFEADDIKKLDRRGTQLQDYGGLFPSPTVGLGVDISALSTIYLRNMRLPRPATPSVAAARNAVGRPPLFGKSTHDQYFFRDQRAMGMAWFGLRQSVCPIRISSSHLNGIWLAIRDALADPDIARRASAAWSGFSASFPTRSRRTRRSGSTRPPI